jgi:DNA-binding MarR family transcriptional regulator
MTLFATLRKIREFERQQLPFLKSVIDFDIVIEIGYAEEQKQPLTPKQLFLLKLGSPTTVRRRLAKLEEQGIITRRANADDRRSAFLTITSRSLKQLGKYGRMLGKYGRVLTGISAPG